jgi:hypothetical protein
MQPSPSRRAASPAIAEPRPVMINVATRARLDNMDFTLEFLLLVAARNSCDTRTSLSGNEPKAQLYC